jgi:hypothetical protein
MRRRRTVRVGTVFAAIAVGLISAGCIPAGPAAPANLTISPSPANFANSSQALSFPMPVVLVTITNTGGHTARNISVPGVSVYSVPSDTCTSLAPGQSCGALIQFCPSSQGQYNSPLTVTGQDATSGAPLQASTMLIGTATP